MKKLLFMLVATAGIIFLSACNEFSKVDPESDTGRLVVKFTDDPFNIDLVEAATVTITKIEIRKEGIDDDSAFIIVSEREITMDLLRLRNGVVEEIAGLDIPKGSYDLERLFVSEAELTVKDQPEPFAVKVPSGEQTGIKIHIYPALRIEGGLSSELLLDIDLSKSFVMRGNLKKPGGVNGFIFKPTLRDVNMTTAGMLEGLVSDTAMNKLANVKVWIEQDSVLATAYTDSTAYYGMPGIPAGTYSAYAYKENFDTVSFTGVEIVQGNKTIRNFILTEN